MKDITKVFRDLIITFIILGIGYSIFLSSCNDNELAKDLIQDLIDANVSESIVVENIDLEGMYILDYKRNGNVVLRYGDNIFIIRIVIYSDPWEDTMYGYIPWYEVIRLRLLIR